MSDAPGPRLPVPVPPALGDGDELTIVAHERLPRRAALLAVPSALALTVAAFYAIRAAMARPALPFIGLALLGVVGFAVFAWPVLRAVLGRTRVRLDPRRYRVVRSVLGLTWQTRQGELASLTGVDDEVRHGADAAGRVGVALRDDQGHAFLIVDHLAEDERRAFARALRRFLANHGVIARPDD
ncbi:MAG: hypothetical protein H6745_25985 [Deltaproteobacteria bacterium]|nr:hypothetical protein [Deltaproteobacteria bacterium]